LIVHQDLPYYWNDEDHTCVEMETPPHHAQRSAT
jgi:hypothetical protein